MWPLLRRLQSTSSPKHAHGAGHVRVSAPHPRCSVKTSRKRRKNFTKLPEEHIFPRREQQSNPPIWINLQPQERQSTERWCRGRNKQKKQKPTIKKILVVLVLTILLNPTPGVCGVRGREVWKWSLHLEVAHSRGETLVPCSVTPLSWWENLCCVEPTHAYSGGMWGEAGPHWGFWEMKSSTYSS